MLRIDPDQTRFARDLRENSTKAERALWQRLRARQLAGMKFKRQTPIGPYVADFACADRMLIVECDGGQHAQSDGDVARDAWLLAQGWRVMRFWNHEVLTNLEGVLVAIAGGGDPGTSPSPQPSPLKGEGAMQNLTFDGC